MMVQCNMLVRRAVCSGPASLAVGFGAPRRFVQRGGSGGNTDRVMQQKRLVTGILKVLKEIAPEADTDRLDPRNSFRDQFDLDSVDYLNFVLSLEAAFGIRIPDVDYPRLSTLAGCVAYLERAFATQPQAAAVPS